MRVRRKSEIAEAVQWDGTMEMWPLLTSPQECGAIKGTWLILHKEGHRETWTLESPTDFAAHYEPVPAPPAQMRKFLNEYSSATNRAAFEPFPEPEGGYPTLTIPRATLKRWRNDYVIFRGALAIICEVEFDKLSPFDIEAAMQRMKSVSEEQPAAEH